MDLMMMERVGDRWEKMEGSCSTGQSPQWAVVPVEEEEKEEEEVEEEEEQEEQEEQEQEINADTGDELQSRIVGNSDLYSGGFLFRSWS
jgi:hypothetical protein